MNNSYFFLQAERKKKNENFISSIEKWSSEKKIQTYIIERPLGENKYSYTHVGTLVLLVPKRKIALIDFSEDRDSFNSFVEDFIEDMGSISDKFQYKKFIGRPREWRKELVKTYSGEADFSLKWEEETQIDDPRKQRIVELLISLLIGSINDIEKVKADVPENILDKIKRKIQLFDGDQTRFIYQKTTKKLIRIQGLSGTGKTELLLHKLKELYVNDPNSRIALTCYNHILVDSLQQRIPVFFNFMKVEQQIEWNKRLWCIRAWGSFSNKDSGLYRYICEYYELPFYTFSETSFEQACKSALEALPTKEPGKEYAFDYVLIDESQDFPESFFELCSKVTQHAVYIAGDIFQNIFDTQTNIDVQMDFLLSKCYRTDPRTLMFAHALGWGLFEKQKLNWLDDEEWRNCGYLIDKDTEAHFYHLKREPLRRFEDIDHEKFKSVEIQSVDLDKDFYISVTNIVSSVIKKIVEEHPTVTPDDIAIILLDNNKQTYKIADYMAQVFPDTLGWTVNKAYETKQKVPGELFVSNRNNVKGLEFPFIICITDQIRGSHHYRNALYMAITRSFLQSYLIISQQRNIEILPAIQKGLETINQHGYIEVTPPTEEEKESIRTTIKYANNTGSFLDFVEGIFDEIKVQSSLRPKLCSLVKETIGEDFNRDNVREVAEFLYKKMQRATHREAV